MNSFINNADKKQSTLIITCLQKYDATMFFFTKGHSKTTREKKLVGALMLYVHTTFLKNNY